MCLAEGQPGLTLPLDSDLIPGLCSVTHSVGFLGLCVHSNLIALFCRARPLSVYLFSMTLCPPSTSFSAFSLPTSIHLPSSVCPSLTTHLPQSPHLGLALQAGRPPDPFLPQVCLRSSGRFGLRRPVGAALPSRAPPAAEPGRPQAAYLITPTLEELRRGRPAPRARKGHNDSPAHTQIHTRRPLTNTRAHAVSPAHP